jgi:hypothetical protein
MKSPRPKNQEEREALKKVMEEVREEWGFVENLTFRICCGSGKDFVIKVERGYQLSIYDFTHDLSIRDLLEQVKEAVPVRFRQELGVEIELWDKRFGLLQSRA